MNGDISKIKKTKIKIRNELKQIAEDIQDLFDKLGFEDLGKGPQKSAFDVRWQDIKYPQYGTERVTNGDTVSFTMRIKHLSCHQEISI